MFIRVKPIKATNLRTDSWDFCEGQVWQLNLNMVSHIEYHQNGDKAMVTMGDPAQTLVWVKVLQPDLPFPENIRVY